LRFSSAGDGEVGSGRNRGASSVLVPPTLVFGGDVAGLTQKLWHAGVTSAEPNSASVVGTGETVAAQ
jgi:hypothetical protein